MYLQGPDGGKQRQASVRAQPAAAQPQEEFHRCRQADGDADQRTEAVADRTEVKEGGERGKQRKKEKVFPAREAGHAPVADEEQAREPRGQQQAA